MGRPLLLSILLIAASASVGLADNADYERIRNSPLLENVPDAIAFRSSMYFQTALGDPELRSFSYEEIGDSIEVTMDIASTLTEREFDDILKGYDHIGFLPNGVLTFNHPNRKRLVVGEDENDRKLIARINEVLGTNFTLTHFPGTQESTTYVYRKFMDQHGRTPKMGSEADRVLEEFQNTLGLKNTEFLRQQLGKEHTRTIRFALSCSKFLWRYSDCEFSR